MKYKFNAFIASLLLFTILSVTAPTLAATGYYININGSKVHSPVQAEIAPQGASAKCKDGTYSFSQHRRGTCSSHRGVSKWLY